MTSFFNRVKFSASTTGTADFGIGSALTGFRTPAGASISNGAVVSYSAELPDRSEWETGLGTYNTTGPVLERTTILESSNSDAKVTFSAEPRIALTVLAQDLEGFQPLDAELTALAGLTSAADKLPYFTGSGTASVADLTSFGRSLVAVANEAAFKTLINFGAFKGHIHGLTLSNNATDVTNDIDIAAGQAVNDGGTTLMVLASAITKQLDAAWAVGTGNGGLDTGTIANATYHMWLIRRSDTGVVDALFSLSATSPTMPANYDQKRRIGSIRRPSGAITLFTQRGDEFLLKTPLNNVNTTNPGTAEVLVTLTAPTGINVDVIFSAFLVDVTPAANTHMLVTSPDQTDTAPSSTVFDMRSEVSAGISSVVSAFRRRTDTSGRIRYRIDSSDTDHIVRMTTHGWVDTRGRNA